MFDYSPDSTLRAMIETDERSRDVLEDITTDHDTVLLIRKMKELARNAKTSIS